jgi:uncharacterized protein
VTENGLAKPASSRVRVISLAASPWAAVLGSLGTAPLPVRIAASLGLLAFLMAGSMPVLRAEALAAMAIVFVASALSSIGGFAFSAICGALLFHVLPPVTAVQLMIVCSIAMQAMSVLALRQSIEWRILSRLLLGGVVSLPLGAYLLVTSDAQLYCRMLGGFLLAYGCFMLLRPQARLRAQGRWADCAAGLCGGITGGLAGFPGALVTIWCSLKGWDKNRQRGLYQPFILIMQILAMIAIPLVAIGSGQRAGVGAEALLFVPAALLGTWCGLGCYHRLSDAQFAIVVNGLLIASGVSLVL